MTTSPLAPSARVLLREEVRRLIADVPETKAPEVAKLAIARIEARTPGVRERILHELAEQVYHEEALSEIAKSRAASLFENTIPNHSLTRKTVGQRLLSRREFDGDHHVTIGKSKRQQLRQMAGWRRRSIRSSMIIQIWQDMVADELPDDDTMVEEHFTSEEVEVLYRQAEERVD